MYPSDSGFFRVENGNFHGGLVLFGEGDQLIHAWVEAPNREWNLSASNTLRQFSQEKLEKQAALPTINDQLLRGEIAGSVDMAKSSGFITVYVNGELEGAGSGVFISPTCFLTAKHVFYNDDMKNLKRLDVSHAVISTGPNRPIANVKTGGEMQVARVVFPDEDFEASIGYEDNWDLLNDVAFCFLAQPYRAQFWFPRLHFSDWSLDADLQVCCYGYPIKPIEEHLPEAFTLPVVQWLRSTKFDALRLLGRKRRAESESDPQKLLADVHTVVFYEYSTLVTCVGKIRKAAWKALLNPIDAQVSSCAGMTGGALGVVSLSQMTLGGIQIGGRRTANANAILMWSQSPAFLSSYVNLIPESEADPASFAQAQQQLEKYLNRNQKIPEDRDSNQQEVKTLKPLLNELYKDPQSNFIMLSLTNTLVPEIKVEQQPVREIEQPVKDVEVEAGD